jgi:hypothetical protein
MSDELEKTAKHEIDDFEGFEDAVEGEENWAPSSRVIKGTLLKFTNEYTWVTGEDEELPSNLELVVYGLTRVVQYWKDGKPDPEKTIVLEPGQKFPDVKKLKVEIPQSEWEKGQTVGHADHTKLSTLSIWSTSKLWRATAFRPAQSAAAFAFVISSSAFSLCANFEVNTSTQLLLPAMCSCARNSVGARDLTSRSCALSPLARKIPLAPARYQHRILLPSPDQ